MLFHRVVVAAPPGEKQAVKHTQNTHHLWGNFGGLKKKRRNLRVLGGRGRGRGGEGRREK